VEILDDSHTDLVRQVASAIAARLPGHISHRELIGWGNVGLVDAARRFDPAKSNFTTFAKYRIRGAILDGLRAEDSVSRTHRQRFRRAQRTIDLLAFSLGRQPDEEEAARANGLTLSEWQELRARFGRMGLTSRSSQLHAEVDALPGTFPDGYEAALVAELRSMLDRAIGTLPHRYRTVILLYYRRDLTMREIAGELGVNESRVSQIHHAALGRLRRELQ
jgi:RNA polymerase sigma factor for flagellar operon FliA